MLTHMGFLSGYWFCQLSEYKNLEKITRFRRKHVEALYGQRTEVVSWETNTVCVFVNGTNTLCVFM